MSNIVLGIHIGHDRGACLIKNQKVLGSMSQERLDRIKYSRSSAIPFKSIDALLVYCKIKITEISGVGLSYDGIEGDGIIEFYKRDFFNYYKCKFIPFFIVNHHDAHAYSTYFSSGLKKSLIFICDGGGDYCGNLQQSESLYIGCGNTISLISARHQDAPTRRMGDQINYNFSNMPLYIRNKQISIGRKYEQITHLLGFGWGEAGKTMGLASYGNSMLDFNDVKFRYCDLNFSLTYGDMLDVIFANQMLSELNQSAYLMKENANIAKTVQQFTELAICSLIKSFVKKYKCQNVCLAGGVFLNCLTNQKIISDCNIENVFILPSCGDDGQALGCAYYAYTKLFTCENNFEIKLPYLGISYSDTSIEQALNEKKVNYTKLTDVELAKKIAELISLNKIIALHRGRTEIGPRALCHRSILANPTNPHMKDILNQRVKHREEFRPFAPTVLYEDQYKYFDLSASSPYMLVATKVNDEYQSEIPSVTHIDGTARVQAVTVESEPFIYQVLLELKDLIGHSIIINTSFKVAGEPIVETPEDAINTFLKTDIDYLAIGNYLVSK